VYFHNIRNVGLNIPGRFFEVKNFIGLIAFFVLRRKIFFSFLFRPAKGQKGRLCTFQIKSISNLIFKITLGRRLNQRNKPKANLLFLNGNLRLQ